MTNHLLTQTLPKEVADLARYYTTGTLTDEQRDLADLARQVADGEMLYSEALDELMLRDGARGGDYELETEDRLGLALADATDRAINGEDATAAQPRRDMHPTVAKGLGIDPEGSLTRNQINALLAGRRAGGEEIEGKRYGSIRSYTDPKTGETKEHVPIGSYDFTLTPDKSVSVAWAFAQPAEQAAIYQAHRDAGEAAMAYLETIIARARLGDGGKDGFEPGHVGWISFDHHTARPTLWIARDEDGKRISEAVPVPVPGDPDLHTHFTVMNAVFCENGRVGSLDTAQLHGAIKEVGALYQAHLAQNLRDRLNASVSLDMETGMARLDAIPDKVRDHFSKRTQGGEEAARAYAAEQGIDWDTLSPDRRAGLLKAGTQNQVPGLDGETREKLRKDDMADFADWGRQAEQLGWKHPGIEQYGPPAPPLSPEQRFQQAYETALPWMEKEVDQRAVIGVGDARAAALRGLIAWGIDTSADIGAVTERFMTQGVRQQGLTTRLLWQETDDPRRAQITTTLHAAQEREFLTLAGAAGQDRTGHLIRAELRRSVRQSGLDFSGEHGRAQLSAIYRLGTGGRLGVFIAAAGAGKTAALKPLVSEWNRQDRPVFGIALAWRQADELTDAGIPQRNVKAYSVFMHAVAEGQIGLTRQSVVVVDELSLLGTRQGLELVRLQEKHGFRMIWLGDDKQAQSIEAGPILELARRALGKDQVPEVLTTLRQQSEREREIAGLFRKGQAADALAMKREDGTAELVPGGYREAAERVAALVGERLRAGVTDLTVSAPTNADAHRLGVAIREERRRLGQVGADQVKVKAVGQNGEAYEMALAAGDKVRLFASTRAEGERGSIGRNGSILTVLSAGGNGLTVRNAKGREGRIAWKTLGDGQGRVRLAYGEVMTTHTAQGSTANEHIYAVPGGSQAITGFTAYSSGTRHRHRSWLVLSDGAERAAVARRRPLNDVRPIREEDAWAHVAQNFSRQPEKELALDFLAQAGAVRRGTAIGLQSAMRPMEQRTGQGQGSVLREAFTRRQEAEALQPIIIELGRAATRQRALVERVKSIPPAVAAAVRERVQRIREPQRQKDQGPRIGR
jgi:hypothetical protein